MDDFGDFESADKSNTNKNDDDEEDFGDFASATNEGGNNNKVTHLMNSSTNNVDDADFGAFEAAVSIPVQTSTPHTTVQLPTRSDPFVLPFHTANTTIKSIPSVFSPIPANNGNNIKNEVVNHEEPDDEFGTFTAADTTTISNMVVPPPALLSLNDAFASLELDGSIEQESGNVNTIALYPETNAIAIHNTVGVTGTSTNTVVPTQNATNGINAAHDSDEDSFADFEAAQPVSIKEPLPLELQPHDDRVETNPLAQQARLDVEDDDGFTEFEGAVVAPPSITHPAALPVSMPVSTATTTITSLTTHNNDQNIGNLNGNDEDEGFTDFAAAEPNATVPQSNMADNTIPFGEHAQLQSGKLEDEDEDSFTSFVDSSNPIVLPNSDSNMTAFDTVVGNTTVIEPTASHTVDTVTHITLAPVTVPVAIPSTLTNTTMNNEFSSSDDDDFADFVEAAVVDGNSIQPISAPVVLPETTQMLHDGSIELPDSSHPYQSNSSGEVSMPVDEHNTNLDHPVDQPVISLTSAIEDVFGAFEQVENAEIPPPVLPEPAIVEPSSPAAIFPSLQSTDISNSTSAGHETTTANTDDEFLAFQPAASSTLTAPSGDFAAHDGNTALGDNTTAFAIDFPAPFTTPSITAANDLLSEFQSGHAGAETNEFLEMSNQDTVTSGIEFDTAATHLPAPAVVTFDAFEPSFEQSVSTDFETHAILHATKQLAEESIMDHTVPTPNDIAMEFSAASIPAPPLDVKAVAFETYERIARGITHRIRVLPLKTNTPPSVADPEAPSAAQAYRSKMRCTAPTPWSGEAAIYQRFLAKAMEALPNDSLHREEIAALQSTILREQSEARRSGGVDVQLPHSVELSALNAMLNTQLQMYQSSSTVPDTDGTAPSVTMQPPRWLEQWLTKEQQLSSTVEMVPTQIPAQSVVAPAWRQSDVSAISAVTLKRPVIFPRRRSITSVSANSTSNSTSSSREKSSDVMDTTNTSSARTGGNGTASAAGARRSTAQPHSEAATTAPTAPSTVTSSSRGAKRLASSLLNVLSGGGNSHSNKTATAASASSPTSSSTRHSIREDSTTHTHTTAPSPKTPQQSAPRVSSAAFPTATPASPPPTTNHTTTNSSPATGSPGAAAAINAVQAVVGSGALTEEELAVLAQQIQAVIASRKH